MIDDGIKGGNTDMALTDFLVAVFMAGQFVLAVVDVDGLQPVETMTLSKVKRTSSSSWTMS